MVVVPDFICGKVVFKQVVDDRFRTSQNRSLDQAIPIDLILRIVTQIFVCSRKMLTVQESSVSRKRGGMYCFQDQVFLSREDQDQYKYQQLHQTSRKY
jgi:hypothetical protein